MDLIAGVLPPDPLTRGFTPRLRWGFCPGPQTPVEGLHSALAIFKPPHFSNEVYAYWWAPVLQTARPKSGPA